MEQTAVGTPPSGVHRVLVIDDEHTIRLALRRMFTRMGWTVDEAANGEAGYAMIDADAALPASARYHLVICDLRMPGLNGIELHARLRATHPEVLSRLVISTGDIVSQEAADFIARAGCEVIQKPFELATVRDIAQRMAASAIAANGSA